MNYRGNVMLDIFVGLRPMDLLTRKRVTPLILLRSKDRFPCSFSLLLLCLFGTALTRTETVQKAWLDKLNLLISPEDADVVKLGGVDPEEALQAHIDASISREAEDRWRCTVPKCTKLFLEQKFVRSHIQKRHKEWLERANAEVPSLRPPNSFISFLFIFITCFKLVLTLFLVVRDAKPIRPGSRSHSPTDSRTTPRHLLHKTRKRILGLKIRSPPLNRHPAIRRFSAVPRLPECHVWSDGLAAAADGGVWPTNGNGGAEGEKNGAHEEGDRG